MLSSFDPSISTVCTLLCLTHSSLNRPDQPRLSPVPTKVKCFFLLSDMVAMETTNQIRPIVHNIFKTRKMPGASWGFRLDMEQYSVPSTRNKNKFKLTPRFAKHFHQLCSTLRISARETETYVINISLYLEICELLSTL